MTHKPDKLTAAFALALRELRQRKGYSLRQLSKRTGIPLSQVHRLETGRRAYVTSYARIAEPLGGVDALLKTASRILRQQKGGAK